VDSEQEWEGAMTAQQQNGTWSDEDDFDGNDDRGDSTAMRELRKADRAKAKRIAELESQLAERSKADRDRAVSEVLQARGLNSKIAALIPSDVEPSADAVGKWLEDFGDVFGAVSQQEPQDDTARQMGAVDDLSARIQPTSSGDAASRIASANSREELDALIFGGGRG